MDMPGFGHSTKDSVIREGETLDRANARIVKEFMEARGIEQAHLYGSSQSGPACMRFGLEYPDRIGKIVLQASSPGGPLLVHALATPGHPGARRLPERPLLRKHDFDDEELRAGRETADRRHGQGPL